MKYITKFGRVRRHHCVPFSNVPPVQASGFHTTSHGMLRTVWWLVFAACASALTLSTPLRPLRPPLLATIALRMSDPDATRDEAPAFVQLVPTPSSVDSTSAAEDGARRRAAQADEERRKPLRDIYMHDDWVRHRSNSRFMRSCLESLWSSGNEK